MTKRKTKPQTFYRLQHSPSRICVSIQPAWTDFGSFFIFHGFFSWIKWKVRTKIEVGRITNEDTRKTTNQGQRTSEENHVFLLSGALTGRRSTSQPQENTTIIATSLSSHSLYSFCVVEDWGVLPVLACWKAEVVGLETTPTTVVFIY